jgi:hypothetical protein
MIAASATPIWIAVSVGLYLVVAGPFLAAAFYVVGRKDADADERAARDVQRFIDLRESARVELAATGSLDAFIALRDEARKQLWQPRSARSDNRTPERLVAVRGATTDAGTIEEEPNRTEEAA